MENPYKDTKNTKHYVFWERANQRLSRQVNGHVQKGTRWVCICLGRLPTQLCLDMIVNPTSPTVNTDLVNLKGTTYSIFTSWPFQFSQRLVSHTRGGGVKKAPYLWSNRWDLSLRHLFNSQMLQPLGHELVTVFQVLLGSSHVTVTVCLSTDHVAGQQVEPLLKDSPY